jgi:hypothetical protein
VNGSRNWKRRSNGCSRSTQSGVSAQVTMTLLGSDGLSTQVAIGNAYEALRRISQMKHLSDGLVCVRKRRIQTKIIRIWTDADSSDPSDISFRHSGKSGLY